jgi:PIN domain nuclease of toxin-antitoxin system
VKALLDTHVLLWWFESKSRLPKRHRRALSRASPENPLLVAEISLWEIATLYELGRIRLAIPLREWLERATAPPLVERLGLTPAVAAEVAALPKSFHRDPADRIIISTARVHGATVLTCDRRILDAGLVPTLS